MSVLAPRTIEASDLSVAWGRALLLTARSTEASTTPLLVSVGGFQTELPSETTAIRLATDKLLKSEKMNAVRVSAMTIFPWDLWEHRGRPPCHAFSDLCVDQLAPRMKARDRRNQNGIYFERMMAFRGLRRDRLRVVNQVEFVIDLLRRKRMPRRSALQIACFDPSKDHTGQPVRGFPCLQQVSVSHNGSDEIAINAYYPTQYIFDRALGNYLGLCQLGAFIAHECKKRFVRLNCFVGWPQLGDITKGRIRPLLALIEKELGSDAAAEETA
jgi:hypothetical protein